MFNPDFTKKEYDEIKSKIFLTKRQEEILEYRIKGYSLVKISELLFCSISTISREVKRIEKKIIRVL